MLNEQDIELLDRYVRGELSKEEKEHLESRLNKEPELQEHYLFLLGMTDALKRKAFISEMQDFEVELTEEEGGGEDKSTDNNNWWSKNLWKIIVVAAVITTAVLLSPIIFGDDEKETKQKPDPKVQEVISKDSIEEIDADTLHLAAFGDMPDHIDLHTHLRDKVIKGVKNKLFIHSDDLNPIGFTIAKDYPKDYIFFFMTFMQDSVRTDTLINKKFTVVEPEKEILDTLILKEELFEQHKKVSSTNVLPPKKISTGEGTITFWTGQNIQDIYQVYVNDELVGEISHFFPDGPPKCDHPKALQVKLPPGQHEFRAIRKYNEFKDSDPYWQGIFEVEADECLLMKLKFD